MSKAVPKVKLGGFLNKWDTCKMSDRFEMLTKFVKFFRADFDNNYAYNIESYLGEITQLFFCRLLSWFLLWHYKIGNLTVIIESIAIFLNSEHSDVSIDFSTRFINNGGVQKCVRILEITEKEHDHLAIIKLLKMAINSDSDCKQLINMADGVDILLRTIRATDNDLLYCLYDLLKSLCIRNEMFVTIIQNKLFLAVTNDDTYTELKITLTKVLISTLHFDDDPQFDSKILSKLIPLLTTSNHSFAFELIKILIQILSVPMYQSDLLPIMITALKNESKQICQSEVDIDIFRERCRKIYDQIKKITNTDSTSKLFITDCQSIVDCNKEIQQLFQSFTKPILQ